MTELASLVLFARDLAATAAFYRTLGIELEDELHEDGPRHVAGELGGVHVAVYEAEQDGAAPPRRGGGSTFAGFYVDSLDAAAAAVAGSGAAVLSRHEQMEWGCRVVVADPDGRPVEINQRDHC